MLLIILSAIAWLTLPHAVRLAVAAVAMVYGIALAIRARRTEKQILAFSSTTGHSLADFDRKPTRGQRRAMRRSQKLALRQTEFRSLFPSIARRTQQFVRAEIR